MAPHSSTLAWKIPWMEEPVRLQVHGVAEGRTQLSDFTCTFHFLSFFFFFTFHFHALEKEMATHSTVLAWRIPGTGSLVGCSLGGHTESDTTEATQQQQQQQNLLRSQPLRLSEEPLQRHKKEAWIYQEISLGEKKNVVEHQKINCLFKKPDISS